MTAHSTSSRNKTGGFVFVSHANADKADIKYIVDALIDEDIKVWLDDPLKMGYSREDIEQKFSHLSGGDQWRRQIREALDTAWCVLCVCTKTYWQRYKSGGVLGSDWSVVKEEVRLGETKLVMCHADDDAVPDAPPEWGLEQSVDVRKSGVNAAILPERLKDLVDAVKRKCADVARRRAHKDAPSRDPFTPCLVDRAEQIRRVQSIISGALAGKPTALFVKGPKNECLDLFRDRMGRQARETCGGSSWKLIDVEWPRCDPEAFGEEYRASLAAALRAPVHGVTGRLNDERNKLLAPVSYMTLGEWDKQQRARLKAWLETWRSLTEDAPQLRVSPILTLDLPPAASPDWKDLPREKVDGVSARRVRDDVMHAVKASRKSAGMIDLECLAILSPVSDGDAARWVNAQVDDTRTDFRDELNRAINSLFAASRSKQSRVFFEDFVKTMRPLYVGQTGT